MTEKRVVLLHCRGQRAGLHQIIGTQPKGPDGQPAPMPEFMPEVDFGDHTGSVSLITVKPRFLLYRENTPKDMGSFNNFHPQQI